MPMSTRNALLLVVLVAAGACEKGAAGGAITFGTILSVSIPSAYLVQQQLQAAHMAVDEINAAGGVLGRPLALEDRDDMGLESAGIAAAHELIDQRHVPAILGSSLSKVTIAIAGVSAPDDVVLMSGASTSPEISTLPDGGFVFRTAPPDGQQARVLGARVRAHGFTRVAVIHQPDAYGRGLGFSAALDVLMHGGTVTDVIAYTPGVPSYASILDLVYKKDPEAILLVAQAVDGAQIIKDYLAGFAARQTFWFFTDSTEDPAFVDAVGASQFTFQHEGTGPGTASGATFTNFEQAFVARSGAEPVQFTPHHYDAIYLLALAVQQAGRADGLAIRDHLRQVANPPGMIVGPGQFAEAAAAIAAGMKVDYEGASGSMTLDENGDPIATYARWQVSNGVIVIVERGLVP
jgi:branched-chain amino acid transport system substrate-binding protein